MFEIKLNKNVNQVGELFRIEEKREKELDKLIKEGFEKDNISNVLEFIFEDKKLEINEILYIIWIISAANTRAQISERLKEMIS